MDEKKPTGRNEPQSYGSGEDWVEGDTGQTVEQTPSRTSRHDEPFYESRHSADEASASEAPAETVAESSGGRDTAATPVLGSGGKKVSESNQTRQTFFRDRDYR